MAFYLLMYTIKFSQFVNFENKNLAENFGRSRLVESFLEIPEQELHTWMLVPFTDKS